MIINDNMFNSVADKKKTMRIIESCFNEDLWTILAIER